MNRSPTPALSIHQRNLLAASHAAAGRAQEALDERAGDRPRPGDLYLLEATADFPVHWLLLEEGATGAFRAVPADTHPLLGPHDLRVDSPLGPLRLRLDAATDLPRAALRPHLCRGALAASELARVAAPAPAVVRPLTRKRIHPRRSGLFALAAGLLGLLAAGWLGWSAARSQQAGALLAERQAAARTLAAERQASARERAALAAALREREAGERRLSERLAELERAPRASPAGREPLLNLPVAILYPASALRGDGDDAYRWPPGAPYLTVVLKLAESETWPRYRIVVRPAGASRVLWQSDALQLSEQGALQLALSRPLLPPGTYEISAQGLREGQAQDLATYELKIAG